MIHFDSSCHFSITRRQSAVMETSILRALDLFSVTIFYLSSVTRLFFNKFILHFLTSIVSALLDNKVRSESVLQSSIFKNMTMLPDVQKTLPLIRFYQNCPFVARQPLQREIMIMYSSKFA